MGEKDFVSRVKNIIASKYNFSTDNVYAVWLCKTLQNNKGLFSTTAIDGKYYEATYNGDKDELYLDTYVHENNECIKDFSKLAFNVVKISQDSLFK